MSSGGSLLCVAVAAAALGAATATIIGQRRQNNQRETQEEHKKGDAGLIDSDGAASRHHLSVPCSSSSSCLHRSSSHPPHHPAARASVSRSHCFEGSISRIGSDASYLEENEYEGDHHRLKDEIEVQLHEGDDDDDDDDEDEHESTVYLCPHCSNYINSNELIVPSLDEDDIDEHTDDASLQSAAKARILSAAEQLNIHLALKDSLQKIFESVDDDGDGVITREQMGSFLKKLGLTGDREQAFLNIVGGDSIQSVSSGSDLDPNSNRSAASNDDKSSPRQVNGINFRQFFDRFQDTLEGMDELVQDEAEIPVTEVIGSTAEFDTDSTPTPEATSASGGSDTPSTPASANTNSTSGLFTPPRSTRLTVNTLITPSGGATGGRPTGSAVFSPSLSSPSFSPPASSPSIRVFLGGACGDTTWRKLEAIPQFQSAGISFYDPQVKEWSNKLVALEGLMKAWCKILFFVIGAKTRALASMIEVASLIAAGRRVVLVIEPVEAGVEIEGQVPSASELKDLNRAREYLKDVASSYNIPVHPTADAGIKAIIASEEEERRDQRARLLALREQRGSISSASGLTGPGSVGPPSARRGRGSIFSQQQLSPGLHLSTAATAAALHYHASPNANGNNAANKKLHQRPPHSRSHSISGSAGQSLLAASTAPATLAPPSAPPSLVHAHSLPASSIASNLLPPLSPASLSSAGAGSSGYSADPADAHQPATPTIAEHNASGRKNKRRN